MSTPPPGNSLPADISSPPGVAPIPTESFTNPAPPPGSIHRPKPAPNAVPCTKKEGQLECLGGGLQQGLCSHGWVIPQPVAMGTVCDVESGRIVLAPGGVKEKRWEGKRENLRWGVRYRGVVPAGS
ncbi:hypothetical protein B0T21DRAFT_356589 [Apiosordaria backusii]|uniref:Uncharacterized protein n=1 Tax=Apiosordaria backusii TaxID=314023 RepID=A0AA40EZV4_9PEZI|nr:hypothetical protein B0T21DRAFT_356589 [Apiosordaria backusii]